MIVLDEADPVIRGEGDARARCAFCQDRAATWTAQVVDGDPAALCAWCLIYSGRTRWGDANKDDLLHIGRAVLQERVARGIRGHALDERGRLAPEDAERLMLGVYTTTVVLRGRLV